MTQSRPLSQSELKRLVARAALDYVESGAVLGVGTGSTVDQLIDQLPEIRDRIPACVSSSERSTKRLEALGFKVLDMNEVDSIGVYIDGADEIDGHFAMIKGGGGALTREKIVASISRRFVCIADASKKVDVLGRFPLPVEVIPMAAREIKRRLEALGADVKLRDFVTDNGCSLFHTAGHETPSSGIGDGDQQLAWCRDCRSLCCSRRRCAALRHFRRR